MDYGNTKTPSMHCRLSSVTLSQLAFPKEGNPNFPREKSHWNSTAVKSKVKNCPSEHACLHPMTAASCCRLLFCKPGGRWSVHVSSLWQRLLVAGCCSASLTVSWACMSPSHDSSLLLLCKPDDQLRVHVSTLWQWPLVAGCCCASLTISSACMSPPYDSGLLLQVVAVQTWRSVQRACLLPMTVACCCRLLLCKPDDQVSMHVSSLWHRLLVAGCCCASLMVSWATARTTCPSSCRSWTEMAPSSKGLRAWRWAWLGQRGCDCSYWCGCCWRWGCLWRCSCCFQCINPLPLTRANMGQNTPAFVSLQGPIWAKNHVQRQWLN